MSGGYYSKAKWPSFLVEKWEHNAIGERRYTGEARTYRPLVVPPKLTQEPDRMEP